MMMNDYYEKSCWPVMLSVKVMLPDCGGGHAPVDGAYNSRAAALAPTNTKHSWATVPNILEKCH